MSILFQQRIGDEVVTQFANVSFNIMSKSNITLGGVQFLAICESLVGFYSRMASRDGFAYQLDQFICKFFSFSLSLSLSHAKEKGGLPTSKLLVLILSSAPEALVSLRHTVLQYCHH